MYMISKTALGHLIKSTHPSADGVWRVCGVGSIHSICVLVLSSTVVDHWIRVYPSCIHPNSMLPWIASWWGDGDECMLAISVKTIVNNNKRSFAQPTAFDLYVHPHLAWRIGVVPTSEFLARAPLVAPYSSVCIDGGQATDASAALINWKIKPYRWIRKMRIDRKHAFGYIQYIIYVV